MTTSPTKTMRPALDRLATRLQPWTDADALNRYARDRDEDAFAHLVRRYGPLVAGVCRRALGPRPEADDAVQATFWALARQAGSIRDPRTLPAWLHAVACRAARKAAGRAPIPSPSLNPVSPDDPLAEAAWREVRQLLDEEVRRLPTRLRLPVLLCYFEELTRDEAADRLGWSLSTVKRRLDLARERLKLRLGRRGVGPRLLGPAGLLAGGLTARLAPALEGACTRLLRDPPSAAIRGLAAPPGIGRGLLALTLFAGLGGLVALLGGQGPAAKAPTPKPEAEVVHEPLPPGAIARFGTTRYRANSGFWFGSFSKDGRWFVSGSEGVELWDLQTGVPRQLAPIRNNTVPRPALSPDGALVANLDGAAGIHLIDTKTGKELRVVGGAKKFDECRFTADAKQVIATTHADRPTVVGYDVATGAEVFARMAPAALVQRFGTWGDRVAFFLVTEPDPPGAENLLRVRVLDAETGKDLKAFDVTAADYADARPAPGAGLRGGRRALPFERTSFAVNATGTQFAYLRGTDTVGLAPLAPGSKALTVELPAGPGGRKFYSNRVWFAPDDKTLFVTGHYGLIVRCDAATGKVLATLPGHQNGVGYWHFDPADDRLTTAGRDGQLRQWDLKTNREIPLAPGYSTAVKAVFSPDGTLVVVGDKMGAIDVYDGKTGKLRHALPRPAGSADWCTFELSPDGRTLAATRPEGTILWWDVVAGKERATTPIPGPKPDQLYTGIETMAFSPDGRRLACGYPNGGLSVLDTTTRTEVWRAAFPTDLPGVDYAKGLAVSADGARVARALRVWDRTGGRMGFSLQVLDARTGDPVKARTLYDGQLGGAGVPDVGGLGYTPDGRALAVLVRDGRVLLLDPDSLAELAAWPTGSRDGFAFGISPDGRTVLTGDENGATKLWEVATGKPLGSIAGHRGHVATTAVSADGRRLLTGGYDKVAYTWGLKPERPGGSIDQLRGESAEAARQAVWALAADPKGPDVLRGAVKPVEGLKAETVAAWIADLDHPTFAKREAATVALTRAGRLAEPAVRAALADKPPAEARERLGKVLAALPPRPSADEVFQTRAVQAMELAGTPAARQVLTDWAAGPAGAWLTVEARAALGRLGR